jgi:hypothetical protein
MRTTVNIHDELLRKAKELALERHETLGRVIEDALRRFLSQSTRVSRTEPTRLATFKGKGLQPGVDLDNTAGLLDIMEGR